MRGEYIAETETSLSLKMDEKFHIMQSVVRQGLDYFIVRNSEGIEGEVPRQELGDVALPAWFQMCDRRSAETQLHKAEPGHFIVRNTQHGREGEYSVSVRYPGEKPGEKPVRHFKLVRDETMQEEWIMWGERFKSLQHFVRHFQVAPIDKSSRVMLDQQAEVGTLEAGQAAVVYYGDDIYEEDLYEEDVEEDVEEGVEEEVGEFGGSGDEEDQTIQEGAQVVCCEAFSSEDDSTLSAKLGDRLLVLYPPDQGWVYVKNTRKKEGYLPLDSVKLS